MNNSHLLDGSFVVEEGSKNSKRHDNEDNDSDEYLQSSSEDDQDDDASSTNSKEFEGSLARWMVRQKDNTLTTFNLPTLIIDKIFSNFTYEDITKLRLVSRDFNWYFKRELTRGFEKLGNMIETTKTSIKRELPKRESMRRHHRLTKLNDIFSALETRYSLLDLTFRKFLYNPHEKLKICFIPGKVLDEFLRVMKIVNQCRRCEGGFTGDITELLKELRDLSSMAMEHYEDHVLPNLEKMALQVGVTPYSIFNPGLAGCSRKRKSRRMCRDNHNVGIFNVQRLQGISPQPTHLREIPKVLQDKIDEQQKKIDSQQNEIRMLRNGMAGMLRFLESALPQQRGLMKNMLEGIPIFEIEEFPDEETSECKPSTSAVKEVSDSRESSPIGRKRRRLDESFTQMSEQLHNFERDRIRQEDEH